MKRIAIIAFSFTESTLCLAKYLAKHQISVDYFLIVHNQILEQGSIQGFEFKPQKAWVLNHLFKDDMPEMSAYFKDCPVNIYMQGFNSSRRYMSLHRLTLGYLYMHIKRMHYDAIDIVGHTPEIVQCHNHLWKENITHTIHEVGSHLQGKTENPLLDKIIEHGSKCIFHSNATQNRFLEIKDSDRCETEVIPFGRFETNALFVNDVESPIKIQNSYPTFLFFGKITKYKGLSLLKEAFSLLTIKTSHFNLIIAGGGNDATLPFFNQQQNCHVLNRFLSTDEMMSLIKQSDVIVLPYLSASQTGIISTCTLYNKPVIATKVGAFPEMIKDNENGLLVEPNNPVEFCNAMYRCVADSSFIQNLSNGASEYGVNDKFDWNSIADNTIKFLLSKKN